MCLIVAMNAAEMLLGATTFSVSKGDGGHLSKTSKSALVAAPSLEPTVYIAVPSI